jgi:carboxypeptidase C (cathepsin A)
MQMLRASLAGVCLALLSYAPAIAAAPPIPAPYADSVTHHAISLGGRTLAYTARAGTLTLRNREDQPLARVFYTAYTLDGASADRRPVTFFYNGGPGTSTIYLRMGSFGPVRLVTSDGTITGPPPYRLVDNQYTLLDKSDLIFIDMPGSGFGRLIGAGTPKNMWGVDEDADAFAQFITRYVSTFHRWNSPKFLFGESYGTTRSAVLSNVLQQQGVALNGIVLLSSFLNPMVDYADGAPIGGGDWAYILYLPTETATAWYYHALPGSPPLKQAIADAEHFGLTEYLDALGQGAQLSPDRFNAIVAKLHRFTGLSEQYIRNSNIRVPYNRFQNELLRQRGITVGRVDSRFQTYVLDKPETEPDWDAWDAAVDAAFVGMGNNYMRDDLKYNPPIPYRFTIYDEIFADGNTWDLSHGNNAQSYNVAPDLAQTMTLNPNLKIFSGAGYYDFATPFFATDYVLDHMYLAPALQRNITYGYYQSGHMVYLHPSALVAFHADLERWYASILGSR